MHISELTLFDYVAQTRDLTTQETEHLQECDDCRNQAIELRRFIQESGDIDKARRLLADEPTEPVIETHEEQG